MPKTTPEQKALVAACDLFAKQTSVDEMLDLLADIHFAYAGRSKDQVVREVYDFLGIDVIGDHA